MTPTTCPYCRESRVVNGVWRHRCATFIERSHLCRHYIDDTAEGEWIVVPEMQPVDRTIPAPGVGGA